MLDSIYTFWTSKFSTVDDKIFFTTTLIVFGFLIVFLIMAGIVISVYKLSRTVKSSTKTDRLTTGIGAPSGSPQNITNIYSQIPADSEVVAIITAAICAYMNDNTGNAPYPGFRVKSIRRI